MWSKYVWATIIYIRVSPNYDSTCFNMPDVKFSILRSVQNVEKKNKQTSVVFTTQVILPSPQVGGGGGGDSVVSFAS